MFEEFHFIRPYWLWAIPVLLGIGAWWLKRTQSGSGWEAAIDQQLLGVLLDQTHRRAHRSLGALLLSALLVGCLAAAGPAWEKLPQNVESREDTLVILLDLSLSMLAEDVKPSRIDRARQKVADILRLRTEGQTALVAYAGDAHAVVPLTDDVKTIENLLFSLSPEMMPVFGSNPDHALQLAHELFSNSGLLQGRILMITDGIDEISSVSRHRNAAFPISVIGIGTERGGAIPLDKLRQPGRFLQTQEGNQVIALRDEKRLRDVASLTFGRYRPAAVGDDDILDVLSTNLPSEDATIDVEREFDTFYDQGHWLAILLVPLVLLSFRKGIFAVVLLAVALPGEQTHAAPPPPAVPASPLENFWDALWLRDDQRGARKMRHGEPAMAVPLFEDQSQWQSAARYRSGDYAGALAGFDQDGTTTGHYNAGNALARMQMYEQAIESYDAALKRDPTHADAQFNKELVERLLEEQQDAEQQEQDQENQANNDQSQSEQDQQQQQQDQSEQQQPEDESSEQQQNEEEQQQQEEEQGEQQEPQDQEEELASRDEKQEALEQWLRRVPDNPGGLLRRKFSHETKQRLRRGEYENRQGEKLW